MARWEPDARRRLEEAALDLFCERGFDQTTVAEIAARAGLTERTFFRHFADKREVLFAGAAAFAQVFLDALATASLDATLIDAVGAAVVAGAAVLERRRNLARRRQRVIVENPELQERERIKLASLATAMAQALKARGVKDSAAMLAAEMGVAVFRIAFERWVEDRNGIGLEAMVRESLDDIALVTARAGAFQAEGTGSLIRQPAIKSQSMKTSSPKNV
jgi:AcrR family transcriptional regulator